MTEQIENNQYLENIRTQRQEKRILEDFDKKREKIESFIADLSIEVDNFSLMRKSFIETQEKLIEEKIMEIAPSLTKSVCDDMERRMHQSLNDFVKKVSQESHYIENAVKQYKYVASDFTFKMIILVVVSALSSFIMACGFCFIK
ncbi:MAG: hypothetical protein HEEMFOPI_01963 [Holosporales bacterium]